jgi:hypothetical protein
MFTINFYEWLYFQIWSQFSEGLDMQKKQLYHLVQSSKITHLYLEREAIVVMIAW